MFLECGEFVLESEVWVSEGCTNECFEFSTLN
jgi:hypothetical protein